MARPAPRPRPSPGAGPVPLWLAQCQKTKTGEPLPNLHNVLLALRRDPHFTDVFQYDEMLRSALWNGQPLEDRHIIKTREWLQANGLRRAGIDDVRQAIELVASEHRFHPVRDYLDALAWDQAPRLHAWLTKYLGTDDTPYHARIGTFFLISMAARIYRPGCKVDYMLVLEGPQGTLKSQAAQALAGQYYSDQLPDLTGDAVRLSMHLAGKWIIEVSELSAFTRAEASHLKAFLTSQIEQYTRKFGRNEVREPRQCVFIGTTNKEAYLRDETGGRRFWPVQCGMIDITALHRDRDQLLAEAVAKFKAGAPWWPDQAFEDQFIRPVQESRYEPDAWEQAVEAWDFQVPKCDANGKPLYIPDPTYTPQSPLDTAPLVPERIPVSPPYSLLDIARGALHMPVDRLKKADAMRVAAMLESMGWSRAHRTRTARSLWMPPPP